MYNNYYMNLSDKVRLKCPLCNKEFDITYASVYRRIKSKSGTLCRSCLKKKSVMENKRK